MDQQKILWNGVSGNAWVDAQELLDQVFKPIEDLLVELMPSGAKEVLDVGCGTGAVTRAVAGRLGANCVGIDISEPMITAARARAERENAAATFLCADAQTHPFEPASFDRIVSRFGVMFFNDPIQAFANLCRAAKKDAGLCVVAFRSASENPFMTTAERAAASLVTIPNRDPNEPGQFAFADQGRVQQILESSGWSSLEIRPIDVICAFPKSELVGYFTRLGPLGLALRDVDEDTRARVIETVRPAFDPYVQGEEVRFTAACWLVTASK